MKRSKEGRLFLSLAWTKVDGVLAHGLSPSPGLIPEAYHTQCEDLPHPFMGPEGCLGPEHSLLTYEVCCLVFQASCISVPQFPYLCDGQMNMFTFLVPSGWSCGIMTLRGWCRCSAAVANTPLTEERADTPLLPAQQL